MELTCLNCTGTFEVGDDEIAATGGELVCPLCGRTQRFVPRGDRPVPGTEPLDASNRREPVSDGFGGAFRKPMQAFGGRRPARPGSAPPSAPPFVAPPSQAPAGDGERRVTGEVPPNPRITSPSGYRTPPTPPEPILTASPSAGTDRAVEVRAAPEAAEAGSGIWTVKSPTGLFLEFPASNLLVNWSAVVENPAPYQVSRGGQEWMSLDEFLREMKRGVRATQAFRRSPDGRGIATLAEPAELPKGVAAASPVAVSRDASAVGKVETPAAATGPGNSRNPWSSTEQFTFKIANSGTNRGIPLWATILIIVGLVAGAAAGVAALFLLKIV